MSNGNTYTLGNLYFKGTDIRANKPTGSNYDSQGIYWRDSNTITANYTASIRHVHLTDNTHALYFWVDNNAGNAKAFQWKIPPTTSGGDVVDPFITWDAGRIGNTILPNANNSYDLGSQNLGWKNLYLRGSPSDSHAIDGTYPFIEFSNSDRTQYGRLIYTHYDGQGGSQSLAFVGNSGNTDTYIKSQFFMTNAAEKTAWNDGVAGIYLGKDGTI